MKARKNNLKCQSTPKFNGYGTEEDSMASIKVLMPKSQKRNEQKFLRVIYIF